MYKDLYLGKVAVVTGGSRGIGFATVKKLLEQGAKVCYLSHYEETGKAAMEKLMEINPAYEVMTAYPDLCDYDAVSAVFAQVCEKWGGIDVLFCNAGVTNEYPVTRLTEEAFDAVTDINYKAVWVCAKAVIPVFKAAVKAGKPAGNIVATASVAGMYGTGMGIAYGGTKGAVIGMVKTLALELSRFGIRVNAIAPGVIDTDMVAGLTDVAKASFGQTIPLRRIGQPEEMANCMLFLGSDLASYVTGSVLEATGGYKPSFG